MKLEIKKVSLNINGKKIVEDISLTVIPVAKSPVARPYLSLSKLLYFTTATVKCISPEWAFGDELIEYNLGTIGDRVSMNS